MNVLSLFDGMSCGQIALDQLDIKVDNYYAAEIDKWAMQVAKKNYPNTKHLGDVTTLRGMDLPKIDLLMGGSPCQGFSFAGKQLNFDDPRSALFFEFVRLLKETKPKYFLLENVRMKQEFQDVISDHLGVKPIMINSALMSAQNRVRLYWTNIPGVNQPTDRGIVLKDILESDTEKKFDLSDKAVAYMKRHRNGKSRFEYHKNPLDGKASCIVAVQYKGVPYGVLEKPCDPKVLIIKEATKKGYTEIQDGDCFDATFPTSKTRRGRNMKDKSNCLTAANYEYMRYEHPTYRKLTPLECERLQTVPDNYTEGVSNTQRYKMLGNGWTVDVIAHILQNMNYVLKAEYRGHDYYEDTIKEDY